jgi:hypothetical protein
MHPNNPADPRLSSGAYVPYFYESGLFQSYGTPRARQPEVADGNASTPYRFASDVSATPRFRDLQTVEQIIAHGYFSVPSTDPVTAILSDKGQTSWLGLDDIISQVRNRYEVYASNVYQIQLGKCAATNSLYAAEAYQGPADSKQFYSRHKRLQELYEQERDERTSLWKDVSRLRQTLPETAQSYLSAHRKLRALDDIAGDAQ